MTKTSSKMTGNYKGNSITKEMIERGNKNEIQTTLNNTDIDGIVEIKVGSDGFFKDTEIKVEADMDYLSSDNINNDMNCIMALSNKVYRQMKKGCRRGKTYELYRPNTNKFVYVRKLSKGKSGEGKYGDGTGNVCMNMKDIDKHIVGFVGNQNTMSGSMFSRSYENNTPFNDTINEIDNTYREIFSGKIKEVA